MADPEFVSAVDEPNYRQIGTRVTGQRLKGKAVSRHVQAEVINSIPSKFETVLYSGDSEVDGFRSRTVRFKPALADIPGPGAYHSTSTMVSSSDSHSKKGLGVGFVSKRDRFGNTYSTVAGPGRYEHKDFLQQGKYDFSTSTNTHQFRNHETQPRTIQHRQHNPGPGAYEPTPVATKERRDRKHALLVRVEPAGNRPTAAPTDDTTPTATTDAISSYGDMTPLSSNNGNTGSASRRSASGGAGGVAKSTSRSELHGGDRRQSVGATVTGRRLFTAIELAEDAMARPNRNDSASQQSRGPNARGIVAHEPISAMLVGPNTERNNNDNDSPLLAAAAQSLGTRGRNKFQHEDQPFLSTSQRFTSSVRHVPAPGAYNPPIASQVAFTSHDGVSVPFKSRTTRSSHTDGAAKGPGPGYYTSDVAAGEEMKQSASSSMFKIQHTNRFGIPIQRRKAVANTPGPGTYEPPIPTDVQHGSASIKKSASSAAVATNTSMADEQHDMEDGYATRGGPVRDRSFPINSPPLKRVLSPSAAAPRLSPVGRAIPMVPMSSVTPVPTNVRPPGPAYYNPAAVDKKSFHLNATSRWV